MPPSVTAAGSQMQHQSLCKGFTAISVAGAFIASIQGQILSTTIGIPKGQETVAIRAVNAFFLSGLVLDILAATLAFLTTRWFERLTEEEQTHLEEVFSKKEITETQFEAKPEPEPEAQPLAKAQFHAQPEARPEAQLEVQLEAQLARPWRTFDSQWLFYTWLGMSLFVPMPLLILGIVCMLGGIYTYVWTQHSVVIASLVTLAGAGPIPFIVGDFFIGREKIRRKKVIVRLSEMQGDW